MEEHTAIDDIRAVQRMVNRHASIIIAWTNEKGMVFVTVVAPVVGQKAPHAFGTVLIRHYKFPNLAQGVLLIVGSSGAPTGTHVRLLQNRKSGFF